MGRIHARDGFPIEILAHFASDQKRKVLADALNDNFTEAVKNPMSFARGSAVASKEGVREEDCVQVQGAEKESVSLPKKSCRDGVFLGRAAARFIAQQIGLATPG